MEVKIDFTDIASIREAIDKYRDTAPMLVGENENGEAVTISIGKDRIVLRTFQKNRWLRETTYHYDGSVEETFDGKWDNGYVVH